MRSLTTDARLEAAAGRPAGVVRGVGGSVLTGMTPFGGASLYLGYRASGDLTGAYGAVMATNPAASGRVILMTNNAASTRMSMRVDTKNGDVNNTATTDVGARLAGLHVMSAILPVGLTDYATVSADFGALANSNRQVNPGEGLGHDSMSTWEAAGITPVIAVVYSAAHNLAMRRRVEAAIRGVM